MPEFGSSFSGLSNDRKLTDEELVRAIRFMVAAEYEAMQLYMQLAESTDNKLAVKVLKDIADEECVHAGEFLRLLRELVPNEEKFYAEGGKRSRKRNRENEVMVFWRRPHNNRFQQMASAPWAWLGTAEARAVMCHPPQLQEGQYEQDRHKQFLGRAWSSVAPCLTPSSVCRKRIRTGHNSRNDALSLRETSRRLCEQPEIVGELVD